jgi:hypothetical protein
MVYAVCCLVLILSLSAAEIKSQGQPPKTLKHFSLSDPCLDKFESLAKNLKTTNQWIRVVDPEVGVQQVRSSTSTLGQWIDVIFNGKEILSLKSRNGFETKTFKKIAPATCTFNTSVIAETQFNRAGLTDSQLLQLIKSEKGVIYIWSPRMVYSGQQLLHFKRTAMSMKIKFSAAVDPKSKSSRNQEVQKKYHFDKSYLDPVTSFDLHMRQFSNHFPRTFVYSKGKIHPNFITGVMPAELLKKNIESRLRELDP